MPQMESPLHPDRGQRRFRTTRWSVVADAARGDGSGARRALSSLSEAYWYPVYGYFRRSGVSPPDAEDLTQSFFARLIEKRDFAEADPERGRFRAYLLGCARNFLRNEQKRQDALKRGAGARVLSIDSGLAESRLMREVASEEDPERVFQKSYALTLLARAMERLKEECTRSGKGDLFEAVRPVLLGEQQSPAHKEAATALGMAEGAVRVALCYFNKHIF